MTQDVGPEDEPIQTEEGPAEEPAAREKRSTVWQWLVLVLLLLLVLWLIWQYLGGRAGVSDLKTTTGSGDVTLTPTGLDSDGATSSETDLEPTVPDVVGTSRSAAISVIQAAGYRPSVVDVYGTSYPASTVFQQNPSGGSRLGPGGTVALLVQLRPESKPMVTVPRLTGLSQAAAEKRLRARGIKVVLSYAPDASKPGLVRSQWPPAGDRIVAGGEVQIQITVKP